MGSGRATEGYRPYRRDGLKERIILKCIVGCGRATEGYRPYRRDGYKERIILKCILMERNGVD